MIEWKRNTSQSFNSRWKIINKWSCEPAGKQVILLQGRFVTTIKAHSWCCVYASIPQKTINNLMRRQCCAAQVTAPLHHQIFTNDSKQAAETRSELVRASPAREAAAQVHHCEGKMGEWQGEKPVGNLKEGWLQNYYRVSECSKLIDFSAALSTR